MSYDRCAAHNLMNCIACNGPMKKPVDPNAGRVIVAPVGWSPEDALDSMKGPSTIQATKMPTGDELDQATKDAIARAEEVRAASAGNGTPVEVNFGVAPETASSVTDQIAEKRKELEALERRVSNSSDALPPRVQPLSSAVTSLDTADPIVRAQIEYKASAARVRETTARIGRAKIELSEAEQQYKEAVEERDLAREALSALVERQKNTEDA